MVEYITAKAIFKKRYKKLNISSAHIIIIIAVLVLAMIIGMQSMKRIFFLSVLIVANTLLLSLDRYLNMPVDIEFSSFSAILFTLAFGLQWGIFAGVSTKVVAMLYNANIRADHFFMILGYMMAAVLASVMPFGVATTGIISVIIINIYTYFVSKFITRLYTFEILMYGASNIIFNFVLFAGFSGPVLALISI